MSGRWKEVDTSRFILVYSQTLIPQWVSPQVKKIPPPHTPQVYMEINEMVLTQCFEFLGGNQSIIIIIIFFVHIMNLLTFTFHSKVGISLTAVVSFS